MLALYFSRFSALGAIAALVLLSQKVDSFKVQPSAGSFGRLQALPRDHGSQLSERILAKRSERKASTVPGGPRSLFFSPWRSSQDLQLAAVRVAGEEAKEQLQSLPPHRRKKARSTAIRHVKPLAKIVLIAGFEAFNLQLYRQVADELQEACPELELLVFTDRDLAQDAAKVEADLATADAFFASLVFDYDNVRFLKDRIENIPVRLVFESALELMSATKIGEFSMAQSGGGAGGPPAPVKALLSKFGSGKEEDRLAGYLKLLKIGPSLLKFVPGKKVQDLRSWLEIYSYWNQGGLENVLSMFLALGDRYLLPPGVAPTPGTLRETPPLGLFHPMAGRYFSTPREYLTWYEGKQKEALTLEGGNRGQGVAPPGSPKVAVLLYRKHVITGQGYISQMIRLMEKDGILPVPIFINGVEAHTVVRDLLTTSHEQARRAKGVVDTPTLSPDCAKVDAVVNTIGFPLVGGPAGTMEAGRRVDVATELLSAKDVPYVIAAPLLVQDLVGWRKYGVQGLQQVVLYSLPELDGAIDTVVLGGLVGDTIGLVPERVRKMNQRIKGWVNLRRTPASERKIAIVLYGFPPNVGAVGTAALLNVPASLEKVLREIHARGYYLGEEAVADKIDGEALVAALKVISQDSVIAKGFDNLQKAVDHAGNMGEENSYRVANPVGLGGGTVTGAGIPAYDLDRYLSKRLTKKVEVNWGELSCYRGVATSSKGELIVGGLQLGNVFIGVQPVLGVEGDPMRLMFERDLTPHPQYVAFYQWLKANNGFGAQAVVHLGMHGTVEWLPGSPLGNTHETWPDVLLGGMPNAYVYAANNPSESILAKRRGYGTIISHNVPPYARAGLYKQLSTLKEVLREFREDPDKNASLRPVIAAQLQQVGLYEDLPYCGKGGGDEGILTAEAAEELPVEGDEARAFEEYARQLSDYLLLLEQRLFSEGLHTLGHCPTGREMEQYLEAYFDAQMPIEVIRAVSHLPPGSDKRQAAEVVRALGPRYARVIGLDKSASMDVMDVQQEGRRDEEVAYEELLLGMEYFRWKWLKLLRLLGNQHAKEAMDRELDTMREMETNQAGVKSANAPAAASEDEDKGFLGDGGVLALSRQVSEAVEIKGLLERNTDEVESLMKALEGSYVRPGVGGDLLRDGAGVLPTGRNIHALDPYRMPSPAAWSRGQEAARKILEAHVADTGEFPETIAVMMWGLDAIKTRGESVAIALSLIGARPVKEGTGRVVKYDLVPLEDLKRPRVDVLASLSGIFRDSFANIVDLLDDLFENAATAEDEPVEMNFIRKHSLELAAKGVDRPSARLFSNPAGDFGSMVNERVGTGDWEDGEALGDTWQSRNAFSYGRAGERGQARPEVLQSLLGSTERIVQEIDSVEYGLTDIQEYYANTGALKKAAESAQAKNVVAKPLRRVGVSVVEAYGKDVEPRELEATLRMEYRTKLLNPKWAEAMVKQGSGGAYEISQRMTALIGWSGTSDFADQWVYDGAAETYALDEEMAAKLRKANPEAFQNMLKRMLEAKGRGFWDPDEEVLERIQQQYADVEDDIELGSGGFLDIQGRQKQQTQQAA